MTQPKALYLADVLEYIPDTINKAAAAELRRLHAECEHHKAWVAHITAENKSLEAQRDALLEALKQIEPILARMYGPQAAELPPMQIVRAAIAKAEENT